MAQLVIIQDPNVTSAIVQKVADQLKEVEGISTLGGVFKDSSGDNYYWTSYKTCAIKEAS